MPPLARDWQRIVCLATGPSLTMEQAAAVAQAQRRGWRAIAVNNAWEYLPSADVLYGADDRWWRVYKPAVDAAGFAGERWTNNETVGAKYGLLVVRSMLGCGLPRDPDTIARGGNSGHQALSLAAKFGAQRVVLVGYDMQRTGGRLHCHGPHEGGLPSGNPDDWVPQFTDLANDLTKAGVTVINCSGATALTQFRRADLRQTLESLEGVPA